MKNNDKKPNKIIRPHVAAKRIVRRADLPQDRTPCKVKVENEGADPATVTVAKGTRQVLEALMSDPLYAASPVRVSHYVHLLRAETPIQIDTERFPGDPKTGSDSYGIYTLKSKVTRIDGEAA